MRTQLKTLENQSTKKKCDCKYTNPKSIVTESCIDCPCWDRHPKQVLSPTQMIVNFLLG